MEEGHGESHWQYRAPSSRFEAACLPMKTIARKGGKDILFPTAFSALIYSHVLFPLP